ncbi:MAG: patatin-like phospholipase family protein [Rhodocyclaceae bacterium]|nr:patatin-like phospholipase family protein [Rhodocyclaceae bacterium]
MRAGRTALVLSGGGARAAYQVGVLAAVRDLLHDRRANPFPVLCGTSAGAINATALATMADNFDHAVSSLLQIWRNFRAGQVYYADAIGTAKTALRWFAALMMGWAVDRYPRSLLDNTPLRGLLLDNLDFRGIDRSIAAGALHALSVTCSGYLSGESVAFYQGASDVVPWKRSQRAAARAHIRVDHLLASSALPFIFPAVKLNREYFGDGSMRQLAPISPAVHLGAERILVVGVGRMNEPRERMTSNSYPSLAQVAGHALSAIFLDQLAVDLERLNTINDTLRHAAGEGDQAGNGMRRIESLVIAPSERLDEIAARHVDALPRMMRLLLGGIGGTRRGGGALASYLLFEAPYTGALIDLGYGDAMDKRAELESFLGI